MWELFCASLVNTSNFHCLCWLLRISVPKQGSKQQREQRLRHLPKVKISVSAIGDALFGTDIRSSQHRDVIEGRRQALLCEPGIASAAGEASRVVIIRGHAHESIGMPQWCCSDRTNGAMAPLSPVLFHLVAPHGKLYQRLCDLSKCLAIFPRPEASNDKEDLLVDAKRDELLLLGK